MQHHPHLFGPSDAMMNWSVAPLFSRDCYTPWRTAVPRESSHHDVLTNVTADKDKYQVTMDIHQFAPNEVTVKTSGDLIIVEGKHEEKQDHHGYISRHFVRKYKLPKDHDAADVVSSLSSDGILCVTAPRKTLHAANGERLVPIHVMGPVHKPIKEGSHDHHSSHHRVGHPLSVQHL